ncbi:MAG: hypothetical protein JW699_03605, partial [Chitinispirillaceae bacterium]|nr:hypothetical protein [Chitinispirillaceae bacterium]
MLRTTLSCFSGRGRHSLSSAHIAAPYASKLEAWRGTSSFGYRRIRWFIIALFRDPPPMIAGLS